MARRDELNEYDLGLPVPLAPLPERRAQVPPQVWERLQQVKDKAGALLGRRLREIRLFGSYARGDWDEGSDVDVLILAESLEAEERDRLLRMTVEVSCAGGAWVSPLILTVERLEELRRDEKLIAMDIDREGITV
ncbi:MAG: nucleotidyltransferase domain-containing protein [Polyangiaceae bacterium]|nr:nucleotidyltransferase domain-containing protein [Polyangiaceae bacterium]